MKKRFKQFAAQLRFRLSAKNSILFIGFYKYFYNPKQGSIAQLFDRYSKSIEGTFNVIQIGANDGITHDPVHKFIKRDRWNGVLLEPQSEVFSKFLVPLYTKNRNIACLNAAIGESDGATTLYKIGFSDDRWATGLASFNRDQLLKSFESGYVQQQASKEGIQIPDDEGKWIRSEEVQVISPSTLLSTYGIETIHLLQIDAEGFDFEVIKMFEIERNKPKLISFESSHFSEETFNDCKKLLKDNRYVLRTLGRNSIAMQEPLEQFSYFFSD